MDEPSDEVLMHHVYDLTRLERLPDGPTSLKVEYDDPGHTPVLSTPSIACSIGRATAGAAIESRPGSHERFDYVLSGMLTSDIGGERVAVNRGAILHTPPGVSQSLQAGPDEPLVYFGVRDTRQGGGEPAERPPAARYVYDMRHVDDRGRGAPSAAVTADAALRLPPGITGKLLSGSRLHVAVLRLDPGATLSNYRRDNEQIVFVAEGELEASLGEEPAAVPQYSVLHVPAGVRHELTASYSTLLIIAQDNGGLE